MKLVLFFLFVVFNITYYIAKDNFLKYHKNGIISEKGSTLNGELTGDYMSYYNNGNVKTIGRYMAGAVIQKKQYNENGDLLVLSYMINGTSKMQIFKYYNNGNRESTGILDGNGLKIGEWDYYSLDERYIETKIYKDGVLIED